MIDLKHGDCLELMKDIKDKSIDMILCDLPYGTTACSWDIVIPFAPLWEQYNRLIKDNGVIALFGSEPFSSHLRMSNIKNYKYDWYWIKERGTGQGFSHKQPLRKIENICVFYNKQPYYDYKGEKYKKPIIHSLSIYNKGACNLYGGNQKRLQEKNLNADGSRKYKTYTHKTKTNVLQFNRENNNADKHHPTQKPVSLLEYLIKTYTHENYTVLDNTMGSGSTGVACVNTSRNFIGIEKDENYFNIAKERIEKQVLENKNNLTIEKFL